MRQEIPETYVLSSIEQEELFLSAPIPEDPDYIAVMQHLDWSDEDYWDAYGELASNGMFRDKEDGGKGKPLSGSDADIDPGDDGHAYEYYAKLLNFRVCSIEVLAWYPISAKLISKLKVSRSLTRPNLKPLSRANPREHRLRIRLLFRYMQGSEKSMPIDMNIKIDGIAYQRNGISGEPFYQVFFRYSEKGMEERKLIAVLTDRKKHCFVIDPSDIQNHWRGDHFERDLRDAIINDFAKRHERSYAEERDIMNAESGIEDPAWWFIMPPSRNNLLAIYRTSTGKTTHVPKPEPSNPFGYQTPRCDTIQTYRELR
jgi:hypothetical protein